MTRASIANAPSPSAETIFARYHACWEARDPHRIASLHALDTVFHIHDGTEPILGREAVYDACVALFKTHKFELGMGRLLYGDRHWVFEWRMALALTDREGRPFSGAIEMLDIVTLNHLNEVARKDVYLNAKQAQAAFSLAGLEQP